MYNLMLLMYLWGIGETPFQNQIWKVSNDVGVVDISTIPLNPIKGESTTIQAVVKNFGFNSQSNFPVYAKIRAVEIFFSEDFDHKGNDPIGWTIIDGGNKSGPPGRWHTVFEDSNYYMESNADEEGSGSIQDEELISPSIDCSGKRGVSLRFWTQYSHSSMDCGDVDVSTDGGNTWTTLKTFDADVSPGKVYTIDISSVADNQSNVKVRFHFVSSGEGWWRVDNVELLCYSSPVYMDTANVPILSSEEEVTIDFPKSWIPVLEGEYTISSWTQLSDDEQPENDKREEEISVLLPFHQPDNQIKNSDEITYMGDSVYNETGSLQSKYQSVLNNDTAIYHIKIENDGNVADSFKITVTDEWNQWVVRYFDALSGGNEITAQITGSGWLTGLLQPQESKEIRIEVVAEWFWYGSPLNLLIKSISLSDNTKRDVVKASTFPILINRPDNLIRNEGDKEYIGDNVYNDDGSQQTKTQGITSGEVAIYFVKVQNDGNYPSLFQVVGDSSAGGWRVSYYNSLNGEDITDHITDPYYGWPITLWSPDTAVEIRVEITADDTVAEGSSKEVFISTFSSDDPSIKDIVGTVTSITETSIKERFNKIPFASLLSPDQNPSKDHILIKYGLSKADRADLTIYDITGKLVCTLLSERKAPGYYSILWDGRHLPAGIYFCRFKTGSSEIIKKLILVR